MTIEKFENKILFSNEYSDLIIADNKTTYGNFINYKGFTINITVSAKKLDSYYYFCVYTKTVERETNMVIPYYLWETNGKYNMTKKTPFTNKKDVFKNKEYFIRLIELHLYKIFLRIDNIINEQYSLEEFKKTYITNYYSEQILKWADNDFDNNKSYVENSTECFKYIETFKGI